jgi:hypothetical protein
MTIPKHRRRSIVVDGTEFHWTPGCKPDGWIVIQHGSGKGAYVVIDLHSAAEPLFPFMKPADVEAAIRLAINSGWNPGQKGNNLRLCFQQFEEPPDRLTLLTNGPTQKL